MSGIYYLDGLRLQTIHQYAFNWLPPPEKVSVTLTVQPMTFKMSSVLCGSGNEQL